MLAKNKHEIIRPPNSDFDLEVVNHTDTVSEVPTWIPGYHDVTLVVRDWDLPAGRAPVAIQYRCSILGSIVAAPKRDGEGQHYYDWDW